MFAASEAGGGDANGTKARMLTVGARRASKPTERLAKAQHSRDDSNVGS